MTRSRDIREVPVSLKKAQIINGLRVAVILHDFRTRKEWAAHFAVPYCYLCDVIKVYRLDQAIRIVRAGRDHGIIQTVKDARWKNGRAITSIRIPACAVAAAGFQSLSEVEFRAVKGCITLTPTKELGLIEKPT